MPLLHLVVLALIQGVTEFLPVSSSGHLILLPKLTGMEDQGPLIDVAAHVGTLGAVILYFRSDVARLITGAGHLLRGTRDSAEARLLLLLALSTVPVILFGAVLKLAGLVDALRSVALIGWTMLGFGLVLYWADRRGAQVKAAPDWTGRDAVVMGLWQMLALIPGTSRSGVTVTAARLLGYERREGARLAMLMSIPTILASFCLIIFDMDIAQDSAVVRDMAIVAALSFVAALAALSLMMRFLRSVSFTPYVIYRVILGLALLWIAYT